jgi:uncharacterized protein (TIGR03067 family)
MRPGPGGIRPGDRPTGAAAPPFGAAAGPRGGSGFPGGPGGPGGAAGAEGEEEKKKDGKLEVGAAEQTITLSLELSLTRRAYGTIMAVVQDVMQEVRAVADLASARSRVHDLAAATQAYLRDKGHFPPGALPRAVTPERGIDWRPDQRLAWTADLLPYLDAEYAEWGLQRDQSWNEGRNLRIARRVIPQLVMTRQKGAPSVFIRYPGVTLPLTATRWVGVAGVGFDAAEYKSNDAATQKKLGVFGYDRVTSKKDITDGPDKTIVLLMVPKEPQSPWLAGGGSTVRGVSEDSDAVQPFVCTTYGGKPGKTTKFDGKPGTLAIMADGKVRFIPADIDPNVFRALCTIAGGETIGKLDDIAPVIEPDDAAELKATGSATSEIPVGKVSGESTTTSEDKDLDSLQGVWVAVRAEMGGRPLPAEAVQKIRWTIAEDEAELQAGDRTEKQTLALDSDRTPKQIDVTSEDGPNKGKVTKGIYQLAGTQLIVAMGQPGDNNRPKTLGPSTEGVTVVVFQRPAGYKPPPRKPAGARRPPRKPRAGPSSTAPRSTAPTTSPGRPRRPR